MRAAVEIIENDALSRGAQNFDRGAVTAIFEPGKDQEAMVGIQDAWDMARALLFRSDPGPTPQEISDAIDTMTDVNYRFMSLGTRRFHEMVGEMWLILTLTNSGATPLTFTVPATITGAMAPVLERTVPGAAGIDHPVITGAGHFLQEDAGERLGTMIAEFIRSRPVQGLQ